MGLATGVWLGVVGLRGDPDQAEAWLATGWHPALLRGIAHASGFAPVPLAEILVVGILVWLLALPFRVRTGGGGPLRHWTLAIFRVVRLGALLVALGQGLWGVQYARPGLEDRLGIPLRGPVETDQLEALTEALVLSANSAYLAIHGQPDSGKPTPRPATLDPQALEKAWKSVTTRWGLPAAMGHPLPAPRPLKSTPVLRRLGFQGVFVPWTGEGLVMADLIGPAFVYTALHESAHQRGVARESDANALAYLVALESADPLLRYGGALALQRQALLALAQIDPDQARALARARLPGVQRDVESMVARAVALAGPVSETMRSANHRMLQSQGVREGVASYQGSLWIIAALMDREGLEGLTP